MTALPVHTQHTALRVLPERHLLHAVLLHPTSYRPTTHHHLFSSSHQRNLTTIHSIHVHAVLIAKATHQPLPTRIHRNAARLAPLRQHAYSVRHAAVYASLSSSDTHTDSSAGATGPTRTSPLAQRSDNTGTGSARRTRTRSPQSMRQQARSTSRSAASARRTHESCRLLR